ncbi:MAG: TRM11 family SAM-dependent methyltransferase [Candidatus Poribacteria bacterium]
MKYQIVFRTSRGGLGIDHEVSKAEFLAIFSRYGLEILEDLYARRRMVVNISLPPEHVASLASNLGYTQAIIQLHEEPYLGEELSPQRKGRWYVGWARRGELKALFAETYVQDEEDRLSDSPDQRGFLIEKSGQISKAKGHKFHRGLSPLDAKFMFNISQLDSHIASGNLILDPFAGFGGIVLEGRRRGFSIVASDIDEALRPGLSEVSNGKCVICDANHLPFPSASFDAIVTEPSFRRIHREPTLSALPELRRALKPDGRMTLLISKDMYDAVTEIFMRLNGTLTSKYLLRRHGGLRCYVLRFDFG